MKLATSTTLLQSAGVIQRSQARVNMNATAFKILSSSLYSDKLGAVLREIGCNAADAHIMVGTPDRPFDVKLPAALDPTFAIKDYGPGLSHEDVMNNYQTYFHSTKADSNDVTGCFGLGSKSPYAYTDQFTVKSAHDGILRIYFCAFDETGVPTTSLVSESPVTDDWPHGIEVSLPISYADQSALIAKAQEIFRWFRVPPQIIGGEQIEPIEYAWSIGRFRSIADRHQHGIHEPKLIMGNVAYSFNHHALNSATLNSPLCSVLSWIYMQDVVFEVPIGTVDVTASRETVEYTPRTTDALVALLAEEMQKLAAIVDEFLEASPQLTTATINQLSNSLAANANKDALLPLRDVIAEYVSPKYRDLYDAAMKKELEIDGWQDLCESFEARGTTRPVATAWYWDTEDRRRSRTCYGVLPVDNKTIVLVNDRPKRAGDRIKTLMASDRTKQAVVFGHLMPDAWREIATVLSGNSIPIDYQLVSDLPAPPPKKRGGMGLVVRRKGDEKLLGVWDTSKDINTIRRGFDPSDAVAIKDIPQDSRYYVVREAGGWGKRWIHWNGTRAGWPAEYWQAMAGLSACGFSIPRYIAIVTQGTVDKLELHRFGFAPLQQWFTDVLEKDQRVVDYVGAAQLQVHAQFSEHYTPNLSHRLFKMLKTGRAQQLEHILAGTQYLTELNQLVIEYRTIVAAAQAQQNQPDVPYGHHLAKLGYLAPTRYESQDFNSKLAELDRNYPKLALLREDRINFNNAFDQMVLAMAVAPDNPIVTPAVNEET